MSIKDKLIEAVSTHTASVGRVRRIMENASPEEMQEFITVAPEEDEKQVIKDLFACAGINILDYVSE